MGLSLRWRPPWHQARPLVFVLMINDLKIPGFQTWNCVDDTTVAEIVPRGQLGNIQSAIYAVENWSLTPLNSAKILGVTLSSDLTWNDRVSEAIKKANNRLYFLVLLKKAGVNLCGKKRGLLPELSYSQCLSNYGLETLHSRRNEQCTKLYNVISLVDYKLSFLLPPKHENHYNLTVSVWLVSIYCCLPSFTCVLFSHSPIPSSRLP